MQAASSPRRKKAPDTAAAPIRAAPEPVLVSLSREELDGARQEYLDALPIAAAVLSLDTGRTIEVERANAQFLDLAHDIRLMRGGCGEFLKNGPIGATLRQFVDSHETVCQFESHDGQLVGGRHFMVRLARLTSDVAEGGRCLVSLIDKTAQVETEKSLRAEMLRDSLTGLPNRLAFNERVEGILENPHFEEGSYAVVVVDMRRFSRINECMGAIAGDELLITFARRLYSALRGGDVLARTGGDEFGILMRLTRGLDDAVQLAERVKGVLSTPFRLSDLEIRVDC